MALFLRNIPKLRLHSSRTISMIPQNIFKKPTSCSTATSSPSIQRLCSTKSTPPGGENNQEPTLPQKLKKAVAEYGSTVIVFHVTISLTSLGLCYLLISSGLEVNKCLELIGISGERATKIAAGAGTFAVSYAVHKVFAPVRIMITLTATPFIVRYLRKIGFLKKAVK